MKVNALRWFSLIAVVSFLALGGPEAFAYQKPPYGPGQVQLGTEQLQKEDFAQIGITEKLGAQVDVEGLKFRDESGAERPLKEFLRGKPVVLSLIYYECPSLCGLLMNGIVKSLKRISFDIGDEYDVIFVSIDPEEAAELAADKKVNYLKDYLRNDESRPMVSAGWHFLTGNQESIAALANQVGFGYRYDEKSGEYNHSAGFFVLTPEAKVSRVHYGVEFEPRDVQLSLVEASRGQVGSVVDKVLMFCYRYDPNSKGYALHAMNLVRAGGAVTLVIFGLYLGIFWFRQRRLSKDRLKV